MFLNKSAIPDKIAKILVYLEEGNLTSPKSYHGYILSDNYWKAMPSCKTELTNSYLYQFNRKHFMGFLKYIIDKYSILKF